MSLFDEMAPAFEQELIAQRVGTYQERVLRYRVFKQLNDAERNPEGNWTLYASFEDYDTAVMVQNEAEETWAACGDKFKVVDYGKETFITRTECWI